MFLALYVGAQTLVADLRNKVRGEDGAVATEYALLLLLSSASSCFGYTWLR